MGLFSGKTITTVSSVTYNIAGDQEGRQNFLKQSLIFLNAADESIGEKLPRMYLNSLGVKIKRAYKHAALSAQGLPTASVQLWEYQEFEDAVQSMLDAAHGPDRYKVLDAYLTQGSVAPGIESYLNQKYGWDAITGLMATPPAGFASDAVVTWYHTTNYYPDEYEDLPGYTPQTNRSYSLEFRHEAENEDPDLVVVVTLDADAETNDSLLMAMVSEWVQSTRSDQTISRAFIAGDVDDIVETESLSEAGSRVTKTTTTVTTDTNGTTTTVRTRIVDATTSEAVLHKYQLGTGDYPELDTIWLSRSNIEKTYFPSLLFRVDNWDMMHERHEEAESYKATKKVCALMGIDALGIRDTINSNPNIGDIDYAFLQAGANMNTESQAEMEYLFRFWEMCMGRQTATQADLAAWEALGYSNRPKPKTNRLNIQDDQTLNGAYKVAIEWDYINKVVVTGTISPTARIGQLDIVRGSTVRYEYTIGPARWMMDSTVVSIRKQINSTQYEEIQISGAVHKNDAYQGYTVETLAADARSNPTEHEGFLVPLHMGIFDSMPLTKRTQLAQECVYMVFNCYKKTKQKWYQTSAFKWILAIILIIITIVTWGAATPATTAVWGAATLAATIGVTIAIANLIMSFVIGYLVSYLLGKWSAGFISVFGEKWGRIVMAVIQIVVSYYSAGGDISSQGWLKTAVQIIDVASQIFAAYVKGATVVQQAEYDAFMDKAEADKKALEKLSSEFFGENDLVSIDYLLQLQKTLREDSPTTFLTRTLMTGSDVVDITMGQISEMCSMNLAPRLQGIEI